MSEQVVNFIVEHYDNDELAEENEKLALMVARYTRENDRLKVENAKLRDAMYTKAGKYGLQHMGEDELRIWATQQAEYIYELKGLCSDMYEAVLNACGECWLSASGNPAKCKNENCGYRRNYERIRDLGIEVEK